MAFPWRAMMDPRAQWRAADRLSRVALVAIWVLAAAVIAPGVPEWLRWWMWLASVAVLAAWIVRELLWVRRTRRVWDAFTAELQEAGGLEAMDAARVEYWIRRLQTAATSSPWRR